MDRPLVSICIPTYRGATFLPATIASILAQSHANFEVWVIDDASPDNTAEVVAAFGDDRIHYLRNETNLGPDGNWNRCLELAKGKYYKLLPHDDLLEPGSLEDHVDILESDVDGQIALVFGSRVVIDHRGRKVFNLRLRGQDEGRMDGQYLIRQCIRAGTNLIGEPGNGLIRRALVEKVGPYNTDQPYLVDLDYWFRVLQHGDAYYTARPSSNFRVSTGSWSVALGFSQFRDFKGFADRFSADPAYGISTTDKIVGYAKARIKMIGRALLYRSVFRHG